MKTFYILIGIVCLNSFEVWASDSKIVTPKELAAIEAAVEKKLQSKNIDNKSKFYGNLLAARELYQYRFYAKSEKYYKTAIKVNINENKSEAYINLIAIALIEENKVKAAAAFAEAKKYFSDHSEYKKEEINYYLTSIDSYLGSGTKPVKGFYARYTMEENLIDMLKKKEYLKAFSSLNPEALKESKSSFDITVYDILNVLINKKTVKNLYCDEDYKKYPDSYAYSVLICGLLNDYLEKGSFNQKRMEKTEKYFNEEASDKNYLLAMIKDVK